MTARIRVQDPNRNYTLFDTQYPTLCLSHFQYVNKSNHGVITTENTKGCRFPMIVMPIYPHYTELNPYIDSQYQSPRPNSDYDDIHTEIGLDKYRIDDDRFEFQSSIPIFMFDIPELAMTAPTQKAGIKVYNPETGELTFDSRTLPLNVVGLCRDGVELDPSKIYGYLDLTGGKYAWETRVLAHQAYGKSGYWSPYSTNGYFIRDNKIVTAHISDDFIKRGGFYGLKPKMQDLPKNANDYQKFYAWYWSHLLVDLTHIYNSLGIRYDEPYR